MKVEVTMPEEYLGDVIGDINSRRGRIEGMEDIASAKMVHALYHYLKCSDILQTYVQQLRDVVTTLCSLKNTKQYQRTYRKKYYAEKVRKLIYKYLRLFCQNSLEIFVKMKYNSAGRLYSRSLADLGRSFAGQLY